jgi:hypothetical protein
MRTIEDRREELTIRTDFGHRLSTLEKRLDVDDRGGSREGGKND